jgi:hypothetical protein
MPAIPHFILQPEKHSLTTKDARHAKKDLLIPRLHGSAHPSSSEDFGPRSESETSDPGSLCDLGDLGGEISGFNDV